jgi:hypothetical protein
MLNCLPIKKKVVVVLLTTLLLLGTIHQPAIAWDSASWKNPTRPTHSLITEWAIDQLKTQYPELDKFRQQVIEGANTELHELPVSGFKYGINLNTKRILHKGTNEGTNDIAGWWSESSGAYFLGKKEQAYFYLGIMLHMIEDMGVPAHANLIYHQGNKSEYDNFEFMALLNWKPNFNDINRQDPAHVRPWQYYSFSKAWTAADAPDYQDTDSFSKTWLFASKKERALLSNRQGRTCKVVQWALNSAMKSFK